MSLAYDVIILAGQSNAVGFGDGKTDNPFIQSPDIYELSDTYEMKFVQDENGESRLDLRFPPAEGQLYFGIAKELFAYERNNANLANSFAQEYVRRGYLKNGRKLLIVKAAVGGTGFSKGHWNVGTGILNTRLYYLMNEAFKLSDDMRIVAFLWHQGEHDAFENAHFDAKTREKFYEDNFGKFVETLRETYKEHTFPIIAGEFTEYWMNENRTACDAVLRAMGKVLEKDGFGAITSSKGLKSNSEDHEGTSDVLHFSRDALMTFGVRYFEKYEELISK